METRKQITYTADQLRSNLQAGIDVNLRDLLVYDLRAKASYVLLDAGNQELDGGIVELDEAQMVVSNIDGTVEAQITADAVRLMLSALTSGGAAAVRVTIDTALQPDFETARLDEGFTKEALEEEFKKRDLQDLAVNRVSELEASSIGTTELQESSVTTPKLAPGSVTREKIGSQAVGTFHLADKAVKARKLAVGAVSGDKLEAGAVDGTKLKDGSITLDKLAPDARSATGVSAVLPSGSISTDKIATGAVGRLALANGAVTAEKLADGAVETSKIATGAVTGDKIAPGSISLEHFNDNPQAALADGSVTAAKLADSSVGESKLTPGLLPEAALEGDVELSSLDFVVVAGTLSALQGVGLTTNGDGDLQATALTNIDNMVGIIRRLNDDGTATITTTPGAFVFGYSGLVPGQFYKPDGANWVTTNVVADYKAFALDANTLRLL